MAPAVRACMRICVRTMSWPFLCAQRRPISSLIYCRPARYCVSLRQQPLLSRKWGLYFSNVFFLTRERFLSFYGERLQIVFFSLLTEHYTTNLSAEIGCGSGTSPLSYDFSSAPSAPLAATAVRAPPLQSTSPTGGSEGAFGISGAESPCSSLLENKRLSTFFLRTQQCCRCNCCSGNRADPIRSKWSRNGSRRLSMCSWHDGRPPTTVYRRRVDCRRRLFIASLLNPLSATP